MARKRYGCEYCRRRFTEPGDCPRCHGGPLLDLHDRANADYYAALAMGSRGRMSSCLVDILSAAASLALPVVVLMVISAWMGSIVLNPPAYALLALLALGGLTAVGWLSWRWITTRRQGMAPREPEEPDQLVDDRTETKAAPRLQREAPGEADPHRPSMEAQSQASREDP